jgi:hypothetical protein
VARRRRPEPPAPDGSIPDELLSRLHPIWKDPAAVREVFGQYVTQADLSGLRRHNLHGRVLSVWAVRNGYESEQYPSSPDWHRLRAAGVGGPPDCPGDTQEESRLRRVAWLDEMADRWRPRERAYANPATSRKGAMT